MDTVDANRALGFPDDCREYTSVHNILRDLGVKSVRLMVRCVKELWLDGGGAVLASGRARACMAAACVADSCFTHGLFDAGCRRTTRGRSTC